MANFRLPDRDIICTLRCRFLEPLSELLVQILLVAAELDLVELGDVSTDGSKVKASASKRKAMSWKRPCQLEEQLSEQEQETAKRSPARSLNLPTIAPARRPK